MAELSKKHLDELFKEGADMQDFAYNEAAWKQLNTMLDAQDKKRRRLVWIITSTVVMIVSAVLYLLIGVNNNPKLKAQNLTKKNNAINIADNDKVQYSDSITKTDSINYENNDNNILKSAERNNTFIEIENKNEGIAINDIADFNQIGENERELNEDFLQTKSYSDTESTFDKEAMKKMNPKVASVNVSRFYLKYHKETISVNKIEPVEIDIVSNEGMVLTLHGSSDMSSVGLDLITRMGWKAGINIGYQFRDRWEISTGLAWSLKKFVGEGKDYNVSEGFWVDDIIPMSMDAKCGIIEIPLDFRYFHSGYLNDGFEISFGLRSYMIHSEWYGFEYDPTIQRDDLLLEQVKENKNKNWVGSFNFSVGYHKVLSNHLGISISPYVQIPITGIGEGKVNLYSAGVQVAARLY